MWKFVVLFFFFVVWIYSTLLKNFWYIPTWWQQQKSMFHSLFSFLADTKSRLNNFAHFTTQLVESWWCSEGVLQFFRNTLSHLSPAQQCVIYYSTCNFPELFFLLRSLDGTTTYHALWRWYDDWETHRRELRSLHLAQTAFKSGDSRFADFWRELQVQQQWAKPFDKLLIESAAFGSCELHKMFSPSQMTFAWNFILLSSSRHQNTKGYTISSPGWKQNVYGVAIDCECQLWEWRRVSWNIHRVSLDKARTDMVWYWKSPGNDTFSSVIRRYKKLTADSPQRPCAVASLRDSAKSSNVSSMRSFWKLRESSTCRNHMEELLSTFIHHIFYSASSTSHTKRALF